MDSLTSPSTAVVPRIDTVTPAAALPGGEVELAGKHLGPDGSTLPAVLLGENPAMVLMSRSERLVFRVPPSSSTAMLQIRSHGQTSNQVPLRVARQLTDGLHSVSNPVVSRSGTIFATISGPRGKQMPVSVMRISADGHGTPFVSGLMNPTGLALNEAGDLFVTSRAEGTVYQIDPVGDSTEYATGMGVATGCAFDRNGNLYVGDRSGTIFKIAPDREIFVHATLEPSVSAYHLAVDIEGRLYVTGPTLSSNEDIWMIEPNGDTREWFRGLGRPQGMAISREGDIYLAACLKGQRGIVRVTPNGEASLALAGPNLVGIAFSPVGTTILATNDAVFEVDLGVEGMELF